MVKRKRYFTKGPGRNPDPERYILVVTKEGSHFRRKRGTVKPALLNTVLQQMADDTKICSPAAKRIALTLSRYLHDLETGRLIGRITALLKKALQEKGVVDFSFFEEFDFQPDRPFNALVKAHIECSEKDGFVQVQIPVAPWSINKHNPLVTELYFDLVLLYGDATQHNGLRVDDVTSPLYSYKTKEEAICTLSIAIPETKQPWMVMLKVSSLEGREMAIHPRHYGMRVVAHNH